MYLWKKLNNNSKSMFRGSSLDQESLALHACSKEGLIINTSSMGGKIYTSLGAWYHASKHAIEGFSDCLRMEVKEFGIKVVVLEPGMINTGFNATVGQNFSYESKNGAYSVWSMAISKPWKTTQLQVQTQK